MTRAEARSSEAPIDPGTGAARTPLFDLHVALGGRMVSFGGHALPMRYTSGTVAEHRATRNAAGLFDVSHMGIVDLHPTDGGHIDDVAAWLERCVAGDVTGLEPGHMRYTLFTTQSGGVLDDLIVAHQGSRLRIVVNAVRKSADLAMLRQANGGDDVGTVNIRSRNDVALVALQGPAAVEVLAQWAPAAAKLEFMSTAAMSIGGIGCDVSRCGYTGEDGFEIAVDAQFAGDVTELMLASGEVTAAGLGARDTLRLEAGLPLVGHELTESTTAVEAGLGWTIPKRRRSLADFPGADVINEQFAAGPKRRRVGISAEGRRPIRDGATLVDDRGDTVGTITSGGFGPTVDAPVAMAYVETAVASSDTRLFALGRKGREPCRVTSLPFVEHRYWKPT